MVLFYGPTDFNILSPKFKNNITIHICIYRYYKNMGTIFFVYFFFFHNIINSRKYILTLTVTIKSFQYTSRMRLLLPNNRKLYFVYIFIHTTIFDEFHNNCYIFFSKFVSFLVIYKLCI